jgi:flagellar motor switch protein FliG
VAEAAAVPSRSPIERAAILLMSLGEADAAQVLRHMDAKEVQKVGAAMAQINQVSKEEISSVVGTFSTEVSQQTSIGLDSSGYVRRVLADALGADTANGIADQILGARTGRGLEALRWMEPKSLAELLKSEHPQIAAIIVAYLEPDQAARAIKLVPESLRAELVLRVAKLEGVQPSALKELDDMLERQLSGAGSQKAAGLGGPKVAAAIMNLVGTTDEAPIFEAIGKTDAELVTQIQDLMLVFADLLEANDRGMQELLREVPSDKLILALKACDEALKTKFFKNMSERAAETLRDDLANKGPVKLSEVEAAQKEILLVAKRLADEGRIQLGSAGGGEEYI